MKAQQIEPESSRRINLWLDAALIFAILIEIGLLTGHLINLGESSLYSSIEETMHVSCLFLLIFVLAARHHRNTEVRRRAEAGERQLDAMLSMLATVKHDLNNDMQVVIGNAELATIMIDTRGEVRPPVDKIMSAAAMAVDRIEQLAVFSADNSSSSSAIDLNSALRECAAKLSTEMPTSVTLQLELAHLPFRVMADRYLLGLSLAHLIRQAVKTIEYGGEIVVKSRELADGSGMPESVVVCAEVFVVRAMSAHAATTKAADPQKRLKSDRLLKTAIDTTKALLERSGAVGVTNSLTSGKSLISMGFQTQESESVTLKAVKVTENYV